MEPSEPAKPTEPKEPASWINEIAMKIEFPPGLTFVFNDRLKVLQQPNGARLVMGKLEVGRIIDAVSDNPDPERATVVESTGDHFEFIEQVTASAEGKKTTQIDVYHGGVHVLHHLASGEEVLDTPEHEDALRLLDALLVILRLVHKREEQAE